MDELVAARRPGPARDAGHALALELVGRALLHAGELLRRQPFGDQGVAPVLQVAAQLADVLGRLRQIVVGPVVGAAGALGVVVQLRVVEVEAGGLGVAAQLAVLRERVVEVAARGGRSTETGEHGSTGRAMRTHPNLAPVWVLGTLSDL